MVARCRLGCDYQCALDKPLFWLRLVFPRKRQSRFRRQYFGDHRVCHDLLPPGRNESIELRQLLKPPWRRTCSTIELDENSATFRQYESYRSAINARRNYREHLRILSTNPERPGALRYDSSLNRVITTHRLSLPCRSISRQMLPRIHRGSWASTGIKLPFFPEHPPRFARPLTFPANI